MHAYSIFTQVSTPGKSLRVQILNASFEVLLVKSVSPAIPATSLVDPDCSNSNAPNTDKFLASHGARDRCGEILMVVCRIYNGCVGVVAFAYADVMSEEERASERMRLRWREAHVAQIKDDGGNAE